MARGRILVVDDEPSVGIMLQDILEDEGYTVVRAATGRRALTLIAEQPPQLIISDLMMPEMDGYTLYRQLRAHPQHQQIAFLLMSAAPPPTSDLPMPAFLAKPFLIERLLALVTLLLPPPP